MKVSLEQISKVVRSGGQVTPDAAKVDEAVIRLTDRDLVRNVVADVEAMPDREGRIAELRAQIAAGAYAPTGDDIADAMIRRKLADRVR